MDVVPDGRGADCWHARGNQLAGRPSWDVRAPRDHLIAALSVWRIALGYLSDPSAIIELMFDNNSGGDMADVAYDAEAGAKATEQAELDQLPLEDLERDLVACASRLFALEAWFLRLLGAFDRREGWAGAGVRSCAHWLSWRCGISLHAAREKVRVARALETLPLIAGAFGAGRVSYSKVRAVTRVATPEDEQMWLDLAESGTATHVERITAGYRRATNDDDGAGKDSADDESSPVTGEVHRRYLPDGRVELRLVLTPEDAALVVQALDAASAADSELAPDTELAPNTEWDADHDHSDGHADADDQVEVSDTPAKGAPGGAARGSRPSTDTSDARDGCATWSAMARSRRRSYLAGCLPGRLGEGLVRVAESFLAHGHGARAGADRYLMTVQVDAEVLAAGRDPEPFEIGELMPEGERLAGHVLRRIGCDATLQAVLLRGDGSPLDVGRARRLVSRRQRRALQARDRGCVFPGCTERRWVDAHHLVHWADGGRTDLSNLVLLCRWHHGVVHELGLRIVIVDGRVRVHSPQGEELPAVPGLAEVSATERPTLHRPAAPLSEALANSVVGEPLCHWGGEPLDLGYAVGALCDLTRERRRGAAPRDDDRPAA